MKSSLHEKKKDKKEEEEEEKEEVTNKKGFERGRAEEGGEFLKQHL